MKFKKGAESAPFSYLSASGFSLVELMIVVAIIGLLSAVAIPNFQKFQAKSKTTEAKLQLAAIYTSEASFYGSYNIYHNCLNYMGYNPGEFRESRYYAVGINDTANIDIVAYDSAVNSDLDIVSCPRDLAPTEDSTYFLPGKSVGSAIAGLAHIPSTSIGTQASNQMEYVAGAGGVIHQSFTATTNASQFTINQAKVFREIRPGY